MKYTQILFLVVLIGCNSGNSKIEIAESNDAAFVENSNTQFEYDFDSAKAGFNSPEEIAVRVIEYLQGGNEADYLETAIPLDAQKYLFAQNFEYKPELEDQKAFMKKLESGFEKRMKNFLLRAGFISEIMVEDKGFIISNATIDTITFDDVRIKNYGGFNKFIVGEWADVTVKMKYDNEEYFFEIPQIIKLKDKWFLYYPEYYIRTTQDFEFIKERKKELNKKADEFWL